jgi:hypothetical protein
VLEKELDGLLGVLAPLSGGIAGTSGEEYSAEAEGNLATILPTLAGAIDRADPEEIRQHTAEAIRLLTDRMVEPSLIQTLEMQIRRYDYDQALITIQHIRDAVEHSQ